MITFIVFGQGVARGLAPFARGIDPEGGAIQATPGFFPEMRLI
jgi:hypothetical protein